MSSFRLGILISGRGSNMDAIADSIDRGDLAAEIAIVISNNPAARGNDLARSRGIRVELVDRRDGRPRVERHRDILEALQASGVQLVVCAGFDEILTADLTDTFANRIINIHPSLLPAFGGGMHAVRDALEFGAKVAGCTVHFVTGDLDNGPVIVQRAIPVREDDSEESLAARILEQEHQALPEAVGLIAAGRVTIEGRRVRVQPDSVPTAR